MARGLQNYPNITAIDSDYPNGRSKDNTGLNDGTPVKEATIGDYQQFFAKLMREALITPNGLPDNEYSGLQYHIAAKINFRRYPKTYVLGGSNLTIPANEDAIVYGIPGILPGINIILPDMADTMDGHTLRVVNDDSSETIDVVADVNIDYITPSPYTVPTSSIREFTLIKSISTWIISDK